MWLNLEHKNVCVYMYTGVCITLLLALELLTVILVYFWTLKMTKVAATFETS